MSATCPWCGASKKRENGLCSTCCRFPPVANENMNLAPDRCLYCDGTDKNCGFCDMGKPLDTREDWDRSWGRVLR